MFLVFGYIYIAVVILSFLCSLVSFRLHYPIHLKLFSGLLGITVVTELTAKFFISVLQLSTNYPVYNIFTLVQYVFLAFYFKQIIASKNIRKAINVFILCYPLFWTFIFLFIYNLNQWNTYGIMGGDLFIVIFSLCYLYQLFTSERLVSFKKHTEFWIAIGLIVFHCCELPITGILNYLVRDWENQRIIILRLFFILQILNIVMYSLFIYAFLCRTNLSEKKL